MQFHTDYITSCAWAPNSRYLILGTCYPRMKVDNRLYVYKFNGKKVYQEDFDLLYEVSVRPVLPGAAALGPLSPCCAFHPPPRQPREGNGLQKDKRGLHAGGLHPGREKPSEALFFPSSCTRRNCLAAKKFRLCGRRFVSLRKAILFLSRKNDRRDGEMLHTNSFSTRFLTLRSFFAAVRPVIETRKRKESLSSWQEIPCLGDNLTRALLQVPPLNFY